MVVKRTKIFWFQALPFALTLAATSIQAQEKTAKAVLQVAEPDMMVRIAEIEIVPQFVEEYKSILKEEAAASIKLEPGVIAIFPMSEQKDHTRIKIVEIYASKIAYQSHLKTPHFLHYKTTTIKMIKSLKLIEMESMDSQMMVEIFKKLK